MREVGDDDREDQRRQRHRPDAGEAIDQIVGVLVEREGGPADEFAGDQGAAQHEEDDHRLVAEPGHEEERLDQDTVGPGHVAAIVADGMQAEMAEQDQERGQPAKVVEDCGQARLHAGGPGSAAQPSEDDPLRSRPCRDQARLPLRPDGAKIPHINQSCFQCQCSPQAASRGALRAGSGALRPRPRRGRCRARRGRSAGRPRARTARPGSGAPSPAIPANDRFR